MSAKPRPAKSKPVKSKIKPMTPGIPQAARVRAYLAGAIVTLGLTGVAWRAWALQIEDGDHYRELAARQHALSVDIPAPRGDVIDAQGRPLAVSADADSIWANPREIHDVDRDRRPKLAKLIGGDAGALEAKLAGDRKFVWIDRHVASRDRRRGARREAPGRRRREASRAAGTRRKTVGGPVIGRADIDGNGLEGIELSMNDLLTGERGAGQAVRDARGRKMFADGMAQPEPGATVQLTLDRSIQAIADDRAAGVGDHAQGQERRRGRARRPDRPRARDGELPDLRPERERAPTPAPATGRSPTRSSRAR